MRWPFLSIACSLSRHFCPDGKNHKHCIEAKRALIEPGHPNLSIVQQCELLGLARSSYYDEPIPESEENLVLMRLLDEQ
jgi:putative transposase